MKGISEPGFSFLFPIHACNQAPTDTEDGGFGYTALKNSKNQLVLLFWT